MTQIMIPQVDLSHRDLICDKFLWPAELKHRDLLPLLNGVAQTAKRVAPETVQHGSWIQSKPNELRRLISGMLFQHFADNITLKFRPAS